MLFLPVWLAGWGVGLKYSVGLLTSVPSPPSDLILFMAVWIPMWIVGGFWALRTLAWMLGGLEEIEIDESFIRVRRHVLGLGRTRSFDRRNAQHLRTVPAPDNVPEFFGGRRALDGSLAFDYGARTVRIAEGLDEAEARRLLTRIQERFRLKS
jgi:hypothetical protein